MLSILLFAVRSLVSAGVATAAALAPALQIAPAAPPAGPAGPQVVGLTSTFAVFIADKDVDGTRELYRAQLDGSGTLKLSPPPPPGMGVDKAWISPDAQKVAYTRGGELYVVGIDGSAHVKVSGTGVNGASIQLSQSRPWSPDSKWLCYLRAEDQVGVLDLYAVRADGTGHVSLSQITHALGDVQPDWSWSPTSQRVEFIADRVQESHEWLYSATPDGLSLVLIEDSHGNSNWGPSRAEWSPDGSRLAYYGKYSAAGALLRVCDPIGGAQTDATPVGINAANWAWSPDGTRLGWTDNNLSGQHELYVTFPNGSGQLKVNGPLPASGDVTNFRWSPTSTRLTYLATGQTTTQELFSCLASGAGAVKLNGPLPSSFLDMFDWHWSPDGAYVSYSAIQTVGKLELFVAAADGSSSLAVNGPMVGGSATHFGSPWSPDGERLVFMADKYSAGVRELFSVRPDGSGLAKVSSPTPVFSGDVNAEAQWTADSARLVYAADLFVNDLLELHAGVADGSGSLPISGVLVPGGDVYTFDVP